MPGNDRHVVADDVVEIERFVGLIDERGDVPDVDRLLEVDKLVLFPQAVEELAEILLHSLNLQTPAVRYPLPYLSQSGTIGPDSYAIQRNP